MCVCLNHAMTMTMTMTHALLVALSGHLSATSLERRATHMATTTTTTCTHEAKNVLSPHTSPNRGRCPGGWGDKMNIALLRQHTTINKHKQTPHTMSLVFSPWDA
jgi:hypothetical protein